MDAFYKGRLATHKGALYIAGAPYLFLMRFVVPKFNHMVDTGSPSH